jgi:hypothetical protein
MVIFSKGMLAREDKDKKIKPFLIKQGFRSVDYWLLGILA